MKTTSLPKKEKLDQINKYMISKGYNIEPLPSVEIIDNDKENAEDYLEIPEEKDYEIKGHYEKINRMEK